MVQTEDYTQEDWNELMDRTTLTTSENTSDTNTYNAYNAWDNLSDKYYFDATYSNELTESVLLVPSNL